MAEFAASNTCGQAVVADGNLVVNVCVSKIVGAFGHRTDEHTDTLRGAQAINVASDGLHFCVKTQCNFAAIWRQVICDWVLDDPEQLFLRVSRPDGKPVEQLHHQAGEALERARNADGRRDFNQHIFRCRDVYLKFAGLVDGRIEKGEKAL